MVPRPRGVISIEIDGARFNHNIPTVLPTRQIYTWSKYANGEPNLAGYRYGTIKPPHSLYGWLPAAIGEHVILVAGARQFPTPEKAVGWLQAAGH